MKRKQLTAIIIAAGYSSRMEGFKPLLRFGEITAVERVINIYQKAGVEQIILVMGYSAEHLKPYLKNTSVQGIVNEHFDQGMYTSIVKGLTLLDDASAAFFIHPVDIPLVREQSIRQLRAFFETSDKGIVYPSFMAKRGHPPLIHRRYRQLIMDNDQEGGLKKLLETCSADAVDLPLADEAILMDMDTQADYQVLLNHDRQQAPNRRECAALLDLYQTPENIRKHSEKVLAVSLFLLSKLQEKDVTLDAEALQAAALLHDIKRREKHHPQQGANLLQDLGYQKTGNIIATHMDIVVAADGQITENELLYLADKLVSEDRVLELQKREAQSLEKFPDQPQVLEKIRRRFENARLIQKKIETITGKGLFDDKTDLSG